jgi:3-phenylpropionate/trans-cinnamate dioxygenase ferredoxin reductase subunit
MCKRRPEETIVQQRIVIIGGGQAAHHAALGMRAAGFEGRITIFGDENLRPYERPPLSKAALTEAGFATAWLTREGRYAEQDIELTLGAPVVQVDPSKKSVRTAAGDEIAYDRLLFATGGRARRLGIAGNEHVLYLRHHADAVALRGALGSARKLVCIGAGVIGLEIASSARAMGLDVTVLEAADTVLARCLAPAEGEFMRALHLAKGVDLRLGCRIEAVEAAAAGKRVRLAGGGTIEADVVVAGVGMIRNTELAAAAGVAVDNGILVDEFGRTNVEGIFAAGDVAAYMDPRSGRRMRLESFYHAQDHGLAVGRAMAGMLSPYDAIPRFWTDQHGINLQVAGSPVGSARTIIRGTREAGRFTAFHLDGGGRVVGVSAANNARDMRPALELIRRGAQPEAGALADAAIPLNTIAA